MDENKNINNLLSIGTKYVIISDIK